MAKRPLEKTLYALIGRWLCRHFRCFRCVLNKGIRYGRIDALGIRDVGGDFAGDVEAIGVEVKRGTTPFTNAAGQTVGYRVYANRVYLADLRDSPFNQDELAIASNLGIGLIQIRGTKCREVLSSPVYQPIRQLQLRLFEKLLLGTCTLCSSVFKLGDPEASSWGNISSEDIQRAIKLNKGLLFGLREVDERRVKLRLTRGSKYIETRRLICPDCVSQVLGPLQGQRE
jgi:hypothetical protein